MTSFLEQLAKEWFEFQGLFVRNNAKFGRLAHGGWKGEIDLLILDTAEGTVTHVETSSDADTWSRRRERLGKKFRDAEDYYQEVLPRVVAVSRPVIKRAIVGTSLNAKESLGLPDVQETSIPAFVAEITESLKKTHPMRSAIPESWPLLRAMQFALTWRK